MIPFARTDNSIVGRWWWTVDRWLLASLLILMLAGLIFSMAASPPVALNLNQDSFFFVRRHMMFLPLALMALIGFSLMSAQTVRRTAVILFLAFLALTALTLVIAPEVKGSTRWLNIAGFTLQPSEFLKPLLFVVCAWMFAERARDPAFPGQLIAGALAAAVIGILVLQPDFGQAFLVFLVWSAQYFMAGMPLTVLALLGMAGIGAMIAAYTLLPHVASRVDRFLDPSSGDNYQVNKSLEALQTGGFLGRGPGEGVIKHDVPDAHTDFIFAVIGEEFGLIACLALVLMFAFVVLRGFSHLLREHDPFVFLATSGLLVQFGLQAIINISVNLSLMPAKGMTLPFISYGGSSLLALAMAMGMVLALTRRTGYAGGYGRPWQ